MTEIPNKSSNQLSEDTSKPMDKRNPLLRGEIVTCDKYNYIL